MILDDIINSISKEVVDEKDNITQNLLVILSAFTSNPLNLRNLSPSGFGKTHMIEKIIQYFPTDNIIKLARATPQSFRYHGKKMVETAPETFVEYEKIMEELSERFPDEKERERERKWIKNNTWNVFDFTNKTLIFLDTQSFALWEAIKTVLSHDSKIMKSLGVNKSKSGSILGQKFATVGAPAVIYCSAKDEIENDKTDEMNTRFITISIKSNETKNEKRHLMTAKKIGLPDRLYKQQIIDDKEKEETKSKVKKLIEEVKYNQICNIFAEPIAKSLDKGIPKDRELKNLLTNINIMVCVNSTHRYVLVDSKDAFLLPSLNDVKQGMQLTKKSKSLSVAKIEYFNNKVKPLLLGKLDGIKVAQIAQELETDKKKLWENYLKPFSEHGYVELSGEQHSGYFITIAPQYVEKNAEEESPLIDTSLLDISCLRSALEWWIKHGFHIEHPTGRETSIETYLETEGESVTQVPQTILESSSDEVTEYDEEIEVIQDDEVIGDDYFEQVL